MTDIVIDKDLVSMCGLYCGACRLYQKGRCKGCADNIRARWCKPRACCLKHGYNTCADCERIKDPAECSEFNNLMARAMGFVLNSDRRAGVMMIREQGRHGFAKHMAGIRRVAIKQRE